MQAALTSVGHLAEMLKTPLSLAETMHEIDSGRPIGVRIEWEDLNGHFVVIDGYRTSEEGATIDIDDPWTGFVVIEYSALVDAYPGKGAWTHSYRTVAT